jgi:hypothetical protein
MKKFADILNMEHCEVDLPPITFNNPLVNRYEALKRNAEIVECPKCGVKGNRPNMMRWHFENCKTVFRNCNHCGNTIPRQGIKESQYKQKLFCNQSCYMESKKGKNPIEMTDEIKQKISEARKRYYEQLNTTQT